MHSSAQLNENVAGLKPSATLAINEHSHALAAQGREVFHLGFGQSPFPVPDNVVASLQANAHQKAYLPTQGLPDLRESVAEYMRRNQGVDCGAEQVLVGPGSKELMFLLQLAYSSELLLPAPTWVSYAPQASILGRRTHWIQCELEQACGLDPE